MFGAQLLNIKLRNVKTEQQNLNTNIIHIQYKYRLGYLYTAKRGLMCECAIGK